MVRLGKEVQNKTMMEREGGNFFVSFEGPDGSGKSTQVKIVADWLNENGQETKVFREPGSTKAGEKVREMVLGSQLTPVAQVFGFNIARTQFVSEELKPTLDAGLNVINDRFTASTWVFQGYMGGADFGLIELVNGIATQGIKPDFNFLVDVPVEVAMARMQDQGRVKDVFESVDVSRKRKIRQGYLEYARINPDEWIVVDGARPLEEVTRVIKHTMVDLGLYKPNFMKGSKQNE